MFYYAQIDINGLCFAELETSKELVANNMIAITGFGHLGLTWNGVSWT